MSEPEQSAPPAEVVAPTVVPSGALEYRLRQQALLAELGRRALVASIHGEFRRILKEVARKLKSRAWQQVYIVPFGPTPLSMQIKLLVYRVCGLESVDVMHVPGKPRVDIKFDLRQLIVDMRAAGRMLQISYSRPGYVPAEYILVP